MPPLNSSVLPSEDLLRSVISKLKAWYQPGTNVDWVNWRKDQYQIKITWHGNGALACYLNFFNSHDRDRAHALLFNKFADVGSRPFLEEGHGWTKLRHGFFTKRILTVNELAEYIEEQLIKHTIIYSFQHGDREMFSELGIPLEPGQTTKEFVNGTCFSYGRETGKNL